MDLLIQSARMGQDLRDILIQDGRFARIEPRIDPAGLASPPQLLDAAGLDALNRAIAAGVVKRNDEAVQADALREALVTRDRKTVYRIDDGIPVLLAEDAIATAQVADFPRA